MIRLVRFLIPILVIGGLFGQASWTYAQEQPGDAEPLDPLTVAPLPAVIEIDEPVDEGTVGGLALLEEMDSLLLELLMQAGSNEPSSATSDILIDGDAVQVQIAADAADQPAVRELVSALGGSVSGVSFDGQWLQGWVPILALADLAQHPLVDYVRHPISLVPVDEPRGVVSSEALSAFNVAAWQQRGRNGQGVHVAVIDGGFAGYRDLLGVELPTAITAVNFVDNRGPQDIDGASAHGTGVAEIVYDIAPGATLSLIRINTNVDLSEAVHWAIRNDVDVITTSIGWYNLGPGDGTGELPALVALAEDAGILWVTSAGNDRERHWVGNFVDNDGDTRHEFGPFNEVLTFGPEIDQSYLIPSGYPITLHLRWSDWTDVDVDFNLTLMRYDGSQWQVVARSQNSQNGVYGQTPTESLYYMTSGAAAPYGVVIHYHSGLLDRPINLDLFAPRALSFSRPVYEHSLVDLGDAPFALTVGAIDAAGAYLPEYYSAEGPTNGPGGVLDGGFLKPDLIAYTNVSTASSDRPFNGTSAATPHVAGAAALVKDAYPHWSPTQVRDFLYARALPLPDGVDVPETRVGRGRLDLGDAPSPLLGSTISLWMAEDAELGTQVQTTIEIVNASAITATASLAHPLPAGTQLLVAPSTTLGPTPVFNGDDELTWQGEIPPDTTVAITYAAAAPADEVVRLLATALLNEAEEILPLSIFLNPVEVYLPLTSKE